ncbi:hypothetical protein AMS68_004451 [Peltaster fructicola]|uniref:Heterokaryon incompatibility domain-containing protein n=1 Tax=Peltaster fructicola TaxID=286661 RepID=A0A6H0XW35_9PEZI|nr:hypothetical protein AMS68_004451 [Peltaster fructicola]
MEHLLLPRGAVLASDERARYIAEPYDNGPFMTYPQRSRFKHIYDTLLPAGNHPRYDALLNQQEARDLEIFLQTWLFFGLLHEVFGDKAPADHFIVDGGHDGQALLSTLQLSNKIDEWIVQHYHLEERGKDLLEHLVQCILETNRMLKVLRNRLDCDRTLLLVLMSVAETLDEVILETLDKGTRSLPTSWDLYHTDETSRLMISRGWCPSDVKQWRNDFYGFQHIFYLSKIEQPKIKDHSLCVGKDCAANQYDAAQRPTVHRCADKRCGSIAVDIEAVKGILADGYIALLDVSLDETDTQYGLKVEVVSSREHSIYVALSHVWADGLGNPSGNALPRCQLTFVANAVQNLAREAGHDKILLWLDTLCCPVKSLTHRLLCIVRMRQIYEEATHVLVLEAALASYGSDELDCVELTARFVYSSWTRRLWTLQEGALARSVWVQLKDKAVDMDVVASQLRQRYQTQFIHSPLLLHLYSTLCKLRHTVNVTDSDRLGGIARLHSAIRRRSVSVASDEPLCLATFLRLNQGDVAQAPESERMKVFWEIYGAAHRGLTRHVIFFTGPRLTTPGFRWSPSTFMAAVHFWALAVNKDIDDFATIHPRGLKAKFPAFELLVPQLQSEADGRYWDGIFQLPVPVYYVRRAERDWYLLLLLPRSERAPDITIRNILQCNRGRHVILSRFDLEQSVVTDTCEVLVVTVPEDVSGEEPTVHACETAHLSKAPPSQSLVLEAAWQLSQDVQLQVLLRLGDKAPDEVPVRADDDLLKKLPNAVVLHLQEIASDAVQDDQLAKLLQGNTEKKRDELMGWIVYLASGSYALVQRSWDASKVWCID